MKKSTVLGLGAGMLAFAIGVCFSSAGKAQEAPDHDVKGIITSMSLADVDNTGVYYQAPDKQLQLVSALDIRHFAAKVCFKNYTDGEKLPDGYTSGTGLTPKDIFGQNAKVGKTQTILQVVRVYAIDAALEPSDCWTYIFAYSEADETPAPAPEPAKKKKQ
jgi:hypothetical protein